MIYDIVIGPIEYVIQIIYVCSRSMFGNTIISVLLLSFFMSLVTSWMNAGAERRRNDTGNRNKDTKDWIKHIRDHFKGDEKILMLRFYQELRGIKVTDQFGGLIPLLLQIPFFIAAYHYLGTIAFDEGSIYAAPDGFISIGGNSYNILPLIMTGLNIISAVLYAKNNKGSDKVSGIILPALFLILLYDSPSGLVLYWCFNNLFSLIRNLSIRLGIEAIHRKAVIALCYLLYVYFFTISIYEGCDKLELDDNQLLDSLFSVCIFLILNIPVVLLYLRNRRKQNRTDSNEGTWGGLIWIELIMIIFVAVYIPVTVIKASPGELSVTGLADVPGLLRDGILFWTGLFLWCNITVALSGQNLRGGVTRVLFVLMLLQFYDHFLWGTDYGILLSNIRYENELHFTWGKVLLSMVGLMIAAYAAVFFLKRVRMLRVLPVISFAVFALVSGDVLSIYKQTKEMQKAVASNREPEDSTPFKFSKDNKNVLIIMLDRAVGAMVPFIMDERQGLKEKYDGFCWYPNSISTGRGTNLGSPALFGGYEYTTKAMDDRSDQLLRDKHNEALRLMPTLFSEAGYTVALNSMPYGNYETEGDDSVFEGIKNVKAYKIEKRIEAGLGEEEGNKEMVGLAVRDYGIFRICPYFFQHYMYEEVNPGRGARLNAFLSSYMVLDSLEEYMGVSEDEGANLNIICNKLTHEGTELQLPDYVWPADGKVNNGGYLAYTDRTVDGRVMKLQDMTQIRHYHVNVAALEMLTDLFNEMKKKGVYDNTRIIIASDHGFALGQFDDMIIDDGIDIEAVNCLLMVKDFDSHGYTVSDEFMTNADVPTIAMDGLIDNPVNPFTGNPVYSRRKEEGAIEVTFSENWGLKYGTTYDTDDAPWYSVTDNIFDADNWKVMYR